ncbi:hypothetical protein ABIA22_001797 [Sinorhizobium fredii]|uniref:hypothetical protein n=1 Tax=Rhizobium fredii TaxID=380 RepID=UPI003518D297
MIQFVGSSGLITLRTKGNYRLTQQVGHADYSVWDEGRIIAQGGRSLMERVFQLAGSCIGSIL